MVTYVMQVPVATTEEKPQVKNTSSKKDQVDYLLTTSKRCLVNDFFLDFYFCWFLALVLAKHPLK